MAFTSTHSILTLPQFNSVSPARLSVLYSDFAPSKISNPDGYTANLVWWKSVLELASERAFFPSTEGAGGALVLDVGDALVESLRKEGGGRAVGLGCVVNEMVADGSLLPLPAFLSSPTSIYSLASIPYRIASVLVARPFWWGLEQLNIVSSEQHVQASTSSRWKKAQGRYVVKATLEKAATNIINHFQSLPHSSISDVLFSPATFRSTFASHALRGVVLSDNEIEVAIKFLERDRKVLIKDGDVIKFNPTASSVSPISSVDRGVLEMSTTIAALEAQIGELETKIGDQSNKLSYSLKNNQKSVALSHLRTRKMYEDLLTKRLGSLEIVRGVLIKVEMAAGDIEILKAYETSTATLQTLLSSPSLQRSAVDATMDNMADALADHAEIDEVLRSGGVGAQEAASGSSAVDDSDLELELEQMVREAEREEAEARERVAVAERERKERLEREEKEARERVRVAEEERERRERQERRELVSEEVVQRGKETERTGEVAEMERIEVEQEQEQEQEQVEAEREKVMEE